MEPINYDNFCNYGAPVVTGADICKFIKDNDLLDKSIDTDYPLPYDGRLPFVVRYDTLENPVKVYKLFNIFSGESFYVETENTKMIVNLGEEPLNKNAVFTVLANIYSKRENDYIYSWKGGVFENYDDAYEFWDQWEPSKEEIDQVMNRILKDGDDSYYELEVKIQSSDKKESRELAFMNRAIIN